MKINIPIQASLGTLPGIWIFLTVPRIPMMLMRRDIGPVGPTVFWSTGIHVLPEVIEHDIFLLIFYHTSVVNSKMFSVNVEEISIPSHGVPVLLILYLINDKLIILRIIYSLSLKSNFHAPRIGELIRYFYAKSGL